MDQVIKQLDKLIDVIEIEHLPKEKFRFPGNGSGQGSGGTRRKGGDPADC